MATLEIDVAGFAGEICSVSVPKGASLHDLKSAIEGAAGIAVSKQRLFLGDQELVEMNTDDAESHDLDGIEPGVATAVTLVQRTSQEAAWIEEVHDARYKKGGTPFWLMSAPEEAKANREVVLAAVRIWGVALRNADEKLRMDPDIVLVALRQTGDALEHAPSNLKSRKDIVLQAVRWHGAALQHASEGLKNDLEVVTAAITSDPSALRFASKRLQEDLDPSTKGKKKKIDEQCVIC